MFKHLRVAVAGLGLCVLAAAPRPGAGHLRIGMTAADIPRPRASPTRGSKATFAGYTIYDALVNWDLSKADTIADIRPGLADRVVGGGGRADQVGVQAAPGREVPRWLDFDYRLP